MPDRTVKLEKAFNIRDLGGLESENGSRVAPGLVFRGDSLHALSEHDKEVLFGTLRIGTIIDLRTAEEAGGDGLQDQRLFPDRRVHHFSIMPEGRIGREPFPSDNPAELAVRYLENLEEGAAAVRDSVLAVAESVRENTPVLFHCAAGRDRTGLLAAVLLKLIGIEDEEIVSDYLLSNENARQVTARLLENPLYDNGDAPADNGVALLHAGTMEGFLDLVDSSLGGVKAWAEAAGIPQESITALKSALLVEG